jgi:hypothetical protein
VVVSGQKHPSLKKIFFNPLSQIFNELGRKYFIEEGKKKK